MNQPLRLTLVLLLVGFGLGLGFWYWTGPMSSAHRLDMVSTWGLGRALADQHPAGKVVVLSNPFTQLPEASANIIRQEESRVEGLRRAMEPAGCQLEVVYPKLKPGAVQDPQSLILEPGTPTPLSFLLTTDALDRIWQTHPDTDLFVSLIGIPLGIQETEVWQAPDRPKFAFLLPDLRFLGGGPGVRQAFERGKLAAVVLNRPGELVASERVGRLSSETFRRHFLLLTEANYEEMAERWNQLLDR